MGVFEPQHISLIFVERQVPRKLSPARPHCIPFVEDSGSCLPCAWYERHRGRDV